MLLTILYGLLVISMIAVVLTLVMGGKSMVSKDKDRSTSNKWMLRRVYAQGIAVITLILIFLVRKNGG